MDVLKSLFEQHFQIPVERVQQLQGELGDDYADDMLVRDFAKSMVRAKCGARGRHIDVRPNRKEQPPQSSLT